MGGDAVVVHRNGTGRIEKRGQVEVQGEGGIVEKIQGRVEIDGGASWVSGKMVGVARRPIVFFSEIALQSQKDVAPLPVPVKPIEIGIERVVGRNLGNVGMIGFFVGPEIKANGAVRGGRNVVEDELKPMFFGITPGMLVGELGPSPRFLLQGEAGQQKTDSGKREGFFGGIFVAEGVQN
jgi:hypothetical protein